MVSIYELYESYCEKKRAEHLLVVNKQYFEKYVFENMSNYIIEEKFIDIASMHSF